MDMRLFNEDGSFVENGGCTKPTKQDADLTTHQMITDVNRRTVWMKSRCRNFSRTERLLTSRNCGPEDGVSINADAERIFEVEQERIRLSNGCLCCGNNDDGNH